MADPRALLRTAGRALRTGGGEEDVHDFVGIVQLDAGLGILVLPEHVAAVIEVSGTDYAYAPAARSAQVLAAWRDALADADCSVQVFIHRRPINWDLPGGYLEAIERQVADAATRARPEDVRWMRRRLELHRQAVLRGEWDRQTPTRSVADLRQYIVIRRASGKTEVSQREGETPMYLPPRRGFRALISSVTTRFGGTGGLAEWRRAREREAAALADEVERFMADLSRVPKLEARRLSGLEIAQLLHLLLRDEAAYDEWIDDEAEMLEIASGVLRVTTEAERPVIEPEAGR